MNSSLNNGTVVILRGPSGSGKSTFVKNNLADGVICSADDYMYVDGEYVWEAKKLHYAHTSCMNKFEDALKSSHPLVVVDNTNIKISEMKFYVQKTQEHGYNLRIVRMEAPLELILERGVHRTPKKLVEKTFNNIQPIPDSWGVTELIAKTY